MADRKIFHDSVVPIPVEAGPTPTGMVVNSAAAADHADDVMSLHFALAMPDDARAELERAVGEGRSVRPEDLAQYSVPQPDADVLVSWLNANGFTVDEISPDRTSVYASAPVSRIEQALDVKMARVTLDGLTYTAARNAPSLPTEVAGPVHAISGLQPFLRARKHGRRRQPRQYNRVGLGRVHASAAQPAPAASNQPPYLPREILAAYGAASLSVIGRGQTIAILIDTFPSDEDLQAFWTQAGVPATLAQIQKVNVKGVPLPPPEGEETLDVQWTSGIAPGATIRIYASGSLSFVDLDRALDRIIADIPSQPAMRQLSISLGLGETFLNGPGGEVAIENQKFLKLAAAGVNVFVSTGDAGSNPDETGHGSGGPLQVEYESSDPFVIGVGGTTLKLAATGSVASEVGWANSGGGKSIYFNRPVWQTAPGMNGTRRLVPDVSATADPDEGGFVILQGQVVQFGGTSWSAPIWAGFCALINEARANSGKPALTFLNPLIYPLRESCFRDIVSGSNGTFHAVAGYDLVTGLGVPNVKALIEKLA
jgi:kumamolisin